MADKTDLEAAEAHRESLKRQAGYSAKDRAKVAKSGAPQRDHAAAAVLHVVLRGLTKGSEAANDILGRALDLLERDGYDRNATWKRMNVMSRQRRRKLTPPKPKTSD